MIRARRGAVAIPCAALLGFACSAQSPVTPQTPKPLQPSPAAPSQPPLELALAPPRRAAVTLARPSADGALVAVAHDDWVVEVWDVAKHERLFADRAPGMITNVVFAGDGARVGAVTHNGIVVWDVRARELVGRVTGTAETAARPTEAVLVSPDLRRAARVEDGEAKSVAIVDVANDAVLARAAAKGRAIALVAFTDDDAVVVVEERERPSERSYLASFDAKTGRRVARSRALERVGEPSANGRFVGASADGSAVVVDVATGKVRGGWGGSRLDLADDGAHAVLELTSPQGYAASLVEVGRAGWTPLLRSSARAEPTWAWAGDELYGITFTSLERFDARSGRRLGERRFPLEVASGRVATNGAALAQWSQNGAWITALPSGLPRFFVPSSGASAFTDVAFRADGGALAARFDSAQNPAQLVVWDFGVRAAADDELVVLTGPGPFAELADAQGRPLRFEEGGAHANRAGAWFDPWVARDGHWASDPARGIDRVQLTRTRGEVLWSTDRGPARAPIPDDDRSRVSFSSDGRTGARVRGRELALGDATNLDHARVLAAARDDHPTLSADGGLLALLRLGQGFELYDVARPDAPLESLPFDAPIANLPSFLHRDLAPRLAHGASLAALLGPAARALEGRGGFLSLAVSRDGALVAIGNGEVDLVRTKDGARLRLAAVFEGEPAWAAFDEAGHFEASPRARPFVGLARPTGDDAADAARVAAAERPGLVRDFVGAAR